MMNKKVTLLMTIAVLGGFLIILLMNIAALFGMFPARYISPNDVRGIAVEHNHLLYTLNFAQQNTLVDIFNRSIPIDKKTFESRKITLKKPLEIQKIIIYRFNGPDIEIQPVGFVSKSQSLAGSTEEIDNISFVYSSPIWDDKNLLEEAASDNLYRTLIHSYDQ